jgi:hypothetical protein
MLESPKKKRRPGQKNSITDEEEEKTIEGKLLYKFFSFS